MYRKILLLATMVLAAYGQIAITIYSDGFALVKETRTLSVDKGVNSYDYSPVPSQIWPQTVHLKGAGITVFEQNYEYDLVGTQRLLEKNIDREILAVTEKGEIYQGTLLSSDGATILLDMKGQLTSMPVDKIIKLTFPKRPERFFTKLDCWFYRLLRDGERNLSAE